jgi:hypothetical protein
VEVTFAKTAAGFCETHVVRSDGVRLAVPPVGPSRLMPHDLVHFVVESELGLAHGFWGCIAAGAVLGSMRVVSGRRRPHAEEHSRAVLRSAGQRLTEAENLVRLVGDAVIGDRAAPVEVARRIDRSWRPRGPSRPRCSFETAQRMGAALRARRAQWAALAPGDALRLRWPLRAGR